MQLTKFEFVYTSLKHPVASTIKNSLLQTGLGSWHQSMEPANFGGAGAVNLFNISAESHPELKPQKFY